MMQVIFDKEMAQKATDKYTVLELDTVMQEGLAEPVVLYAIVDRIPIQEIPTLDGYRDLHEQMMLYYKQGDWEDARSLIPFLKGKWSGDLDSFYENIEEFMSNTAQSEWTGVRYTQPGPVD